VYLATNREDGSCLDVRHRENTGQAVYSDLPSTLPTCTYTDVDYTTSDATVIVIGGETEGLSREAWDLCRDWAGASVNIPMLPGVESLNCSVAGSIILFEISRQWRNHLKSNRLDTSL